MQYDHEIRQNSRSGVVSTGRGISSFYPDPQERHADAESISKGPPGADDHQSTRPMGTDDDATRSSGPSHASFGIDDVDSSPYVDPRVTSTLTQGDTAAPSIYEDEDVSVDFNESISSEEHRLLQEIEEDALRDEELQEGPRSRAALLASPLVQAAASALVASGGGALASGATRGSGRAQNDPLLYNGTANSIASRSQESNDGSRFAGNEWQNQDDDFGDDPHLEKYQASMGLEVGTIPEKDDASDARRAAILRRQRLRRVLFALGWAVAVGLIAGSLVVVLVRNGDDSEDSSPTASPVPTTVSTMSPSRLPTFRTRPPTETEPSSLTPITTRMPTAPPTSAPSRGSLPTSFPTPRPVTAPVFVTSAPSYPGNTEQRQEDILAMCIELSGVLKIVDTTSPQHAAYQWILNGDPMQLLVSDSPAIEQRYILAVLYYSTNADNTWLRCGDPGGDSPCDVNTRRFLAGGPECGWLGVSCKSGFVTAVNLRENGLQGELPREIGEMSRLESIIFSRNSLSSTIPSILSGLRDLRVLLLNRNMLSGEIPAEFSTLSSIWYMHLGSNQIEGTIPREIFVRSLQHLDLGDNRLVGAIPSLLHLGSPSLINIDVSRNELSGPIPATLGVLSVLQSFTADNNALTGSLSGSLFVDSLKVFDVSSNLLTGRIPEELFNFGRSLTMFNVGNNTIGGNLSRRFAEFPRLEQLILWQNEFIGPVPSRLGLLTKLEVLQLSQTDLDGTMPEQICNLRTSSLRILSANCGGNPPELECDCCSLCFP